MNGSVGIAELRKDLGKYLRLAASGERVTVTDHRQPIAVITPLPENERLIDRLIQEHNLIPASKTVSEIKPLTVKDPDPYALSNTLKEIRSSEEN